MASKRIAVLAVTAALIGCLGLAACGGTQESSSSAATQTSTETTTQTTTETTTDTTTDTSTTSTTTSEQTDTDATPESSTTTQTTTNTEAAATDSAASETPTTTTDSYIGEEAAKTAALSHAGVAQADAMGLQAELDLDDGAAHYDVEFTAGGVEYDYSIDAVTGNVLHYESEVDD